MDENQIQCFSLPLICVRVCVNLNYLPCKNFHCEHIDVNDAAWSVSKQVYAKPQNFMQNEH